MGYWHVLCCRHYINRVLNAQLIMTYNVTYLKLQKYLSYPHHSVITAYMFRLIDLFWYIILIK